MSVGNWIHRLFNPHCPECILEDKDSKVCVSCEILKQQLSISNQEKFMLLNKLTHRDDEQVKIVVPPSDEMGVKLPRRVPWAVQRQMLEAEDREKAKLINKAPKPKTDTNVEELEKELDIAGHAKTAS